MNHRLIGYRTLGQKADNATIHFYKNPIRRLTLCPTVCNGFAVLRGLYQRYRGVKAE